MIDDIKERARPYFASMPEFSICEEVRWNVLQHYNRETIHFDQRLMNSRLSAAETDLISQIQLTENEIVPFHANDIPLNVTVSDLDERNESCREFSEEPLAFLRIEKFLTQSFLANSETGRRPYPSGGGLYAVDVFVMILPSRISDKKLRAGIYHFRPISKALQPLVYIEEDKLKDLFWGGDNKCKPHFVIIYSLQLSKAIFKYRYRGYRNSLIEVGLMGQQATSVAQKLGLGSCLWGGFNEHEVRKQLRLDPCENLPIMLHLFGEPQSVCK